MKQVLLNYQNLINKVEWTDPLYYGDEETPAKHFR